MNLKKVNVFNNKNQLKLHNKIQKLSLTTLPILAYMKFEDNLKDDFELKNLSFEKTSQLDLNSEITPLTTLFDCLENKTKYTIETNELTNFIEHLPTSKNIFEFLRLLKFIEPLNDLLNGKTDAAQAKFIARIAEYSPIIALAKSGNLLWGGIKGSVLAIKGIESDHTGFLKGYQKAFSNWRKGRKEIEQDLMEANEPKKKLTKDEEFELFKKKYDKKQKIIKKWVTDRNTEYNIHKQKCKAIYDKNLVKDSIITSTFFKIFQEEKNRNLFYETQLKNITSNNIFDIETVQNDLINLQNEQKNIKLFFDNYVKNLEKSFAYLNDKKLIKQKINETCQNVQKFYESQQCKLNNEINKIYNIILLHKIMKIKTNNIGFNKIAGYQEIKNELKQIFITPIKRINTKMRSEIPNIILFYGPKGCGKSLFVKALEDETKSNVIEIESTLNSKIDYENLINAIKIANTNYEKNKTHTIIKIEEIDSFMNDSLMHSDYEKLLSLFKKNNNYTILATTNFPSKINSQILSLNKFTKIFIAPANKKNLSEVLSYYISDFADNSINYDKLLQHIINIAGNDFYSNAKIASSIQKGIKTIYVKNGKLNQNDFLNILSEVKPDIKKEIINLYT